MSWNSIGNLMPVPQKIEVLSEKFRLEDDFCAGLKGVESQRAFAAMDRMLNRLRGRTGFDFIQPVVNRANNCEDAKFILKVERVGRLQLNEDESYRLEITEDMIILKSKTDLGALRGIETFLQLLDADENGYFFPTVVIVDKPRFPWRGLLIDACRHFMPVEVIKRNIDGMAMAKMNVLHWHLTEDQGFRVECKTFPKLHEQGSDGYYYSHEQITDIIEYAALRGIRVMPEFDLPGHATSWFVGYPQYASQPGPYTIERHWGIMDPAFNPADEQTYIFLDAFFKEMAALFPDEYMHIGGDENNGKQWDRNSSIQAFMKAKDFKDNQTLQAYFNRRLLKILTKYDKKMMGWEEILHEDMPRNIVIQSWHGAESLERAAKMGYQAILSRGYYIDLIQPTDYHYLNDPLSEELDLDEKQKRLILGGEATMWSEMVSPETVDSRIWPRTAAIAERLWSKAEVRHIPEMYRRLERFSFRLEELGLTHIKNIDMLLRRLSNNGDIQALKVLLGAIEPVKIYKRNKLRKQYTHTPLTRMVDAAGADAKAARVFRVAVSTYLKKGEQAENLKKQLIIWRDNHEKLESLFVQSPVLREAKAMSLHLKELALIGLEALSRIENKRVADELWKERVMDQIETAKEPVAQTELMIISAIEALVAHISG